MTEPERPDITQAVDAAFETAQVPFLRTLVDSPSHTYAKSDVEAAAALVDKRAAALGLIVERHPDPDGQFADHRVYRTPATSDTRAALALVGHIDTVFPRTLGFLSMTRDVDDKGAPGDVIRGPGVLDMKSGLSSILFALEALQRAAPKRFEVLEIRFIMVSDEEVGSPSSRALFSALAPKISGALVFEAGRAHDQIVTARKGTAGFRVTARGRAAHAGLKHKEGINAIHALALAIPRIEALTNYDAGSTVNVGLVAGGTAKNTVPDEAHCVIDARFVSPAGMQSIEAGLETLCKTTLADDPRLSGAQLELSGGVARPPMVASEDTQALRVAYERHAASAGLRIGEAPLQGGGSDANLLSGHGVPCIDGLGPYGQNFHKVEEWSSLSSLRARTIALAHFLFEVAETEDRGG